MTGLREYRRDRELPRKGGDAELVVPTDSEVAAWIEKELPGDSPVASLHLAYARWKPSTSLTCSFVVQYEGGHCETIALKRYADGKDRDLMPRRSTAESAGFAVIPKERAAVWRSLADRRLPGQAWTQDGRAVARMFEEAQLVPGRSVRRRRVECHALRYKPERRAVWHLTLKLREEAVARRDFALRVLPKQGFGHRVGVRRAFLAAGGGELSPPLAAVFDSHCVVVEPWIECTPMAPADFGHARMAGEMAARLHGLPGAPKPGPARQADLERDLFDFGDGLRDLARSWRSRARPIPKGWVHGDLHPDQFAITRDPRAEGGALLLDLDELKCGDPCADLASWVADHLTSNPELSLEEVEGDLLEGYLEGGGNCPPPSALRAHVADALSLRAAGALRRIEEGAEEKAARLLGLAQKLAGSESKVFVPAVRGLDSAASSALRMIGAPTGADVFDRVDLTKSGELEFSARHGGRVRYIRVGTNGIREFFVHADPKVPRAREVGRAAEILSYRPGRRLVVLSDDEVIKAYRRGRAEDALLRHDVASKALASSPGLTTPRGRMRAQDEAAIRFEYCKGEPLMLELNKAELLFTIGAGISRMQRSSARELPSHTASDELAILATRAERMRLGGLNKPSEWEATFQALEASASVLPAPDFGLAHRDLHDGQFLITEAGPVLLDFDLAARADVALDPANLLAHLAWRVQQKIRGATQQSVEALAEAFLEGIDRGHDEAFWPRLRFYQAATFMRLALVYSIRPRWAKQASGLVQLAEGSLRDLQRIAGS